MFLQSDMFQQPSPKDTMWYGGCSKHVSSNAGIYLLDLISFFKILQVLFLLISSTSRSITSNNAQLFGPHFCLFILYTILFCLLVY
jgi:hypothetical protein